MNRPERIQRREVFNKQTNRTVIEILIDGIVRHKCHGYNKDQVSIDIVDLLINSNCSLEKMAKTLGERGGRLKEDTKHQEFLPLTGPFTGKLAESK